MIKTLLITTVMNLQILYPSADVCEQAKTEILKNDPNAVCIPAGQSLSPADQMFDRFFDLVSKLQKLDNEQSK